MNKITIIGRVGKPVELKQLTDNQVASFTVATTDRNKEKTVQWHNVTAWGKTAEIAAQYLAKGSQVCIVGRVAYREYEKDGIKHRVTDVICEELELIGSKDATQQSAPQAPKSESSPYASSIPSADDSDLPF